MTLRRMTIVGLALVLLTLVPTPARADIVGFLGANLTPGSQPVYGGALSLSVLVVNVEFEYAYCAEDLAKGLPGQATGIVSLQFVTPTGRVQAYGGAGIGVARETLAGVDSSIRTAGSIGGGVKFGLVGPLGLRVDYRVITLNKSLGLDTGARQRFYVGLNLHF